MHRAAREYLLQVPDGLFRQRATVAGAARTAAGLFNSRFGLIRTN